MAEVNIIINAKNMASKALNDAKGDLQGLGKSAEGSEKSTGKFAQTWSMAMLGINQGIQIVRQVGQAMEAAFDFTRQGAQVIQTERAFGSMMETIGMGTDVLGDWRDAVDGTISDLQLMSGFQTIAAGTSKELTAAFAENNAKLLEISKAASALNPQLGDTAYMYESITRGIKRNSPLILDNLGIVVKVGEANEKLAQQLGITVDELTAEQKQMALLNQVLETGDTLINQLGGSIKSATDAWDEMTAATKNHTDMLKEASAEALMPMVENIAEAATRSVSFQKALDRGAFTAKEYGEELKRFNKGLGEFGSMMEWITQKTNEYDAALEFANQDVGYLVDKWAMAGVSAEEIEARLIALGFVLDDTSGSINEMTQANKELLSLSESLTGMHQSYSEDLIGIESNLSAVNDELLELYANQELTTEQKERVAELEGEYGDLLGAIDLVQQKHREATNAMIYDLIAQKLSADGLTDAEFTLLMHIGENMGIIESGAGDAAIALDGMLDGVLEDGEVTKTELGDVQEIIDGMYETSVPNAKGILDEMLVNIKADGEVTRDELQDIYDITGDLYNDADARQAALDEILDGFASDAADGSLNITDIQTHLNELDGKTFETTLIVNVVESGGSVPEIDKAAGGMIRAAAGRRALSAPYWVGELGPEPFFPAQDGRIISNSEARSAMRSGGKGGLRPVIVNINSPITTLNKNFLEQELTPIMRNIMRRER